MLKITVYYDEPTQFSLIGATTINLIAEASERPLAELRGGKRFFGLELTAEIAIGKRNCEFKKYSTEEH